MKEKKSSMSLRTHKKNDYPVCRTTAPHSSWCLDPLFESETQRSLYVVPWDPQLQIIPELQETGWFRSPVPAVVINPAEHISIQSRSSHCLKHIRSDQKEVSTWFWCLLILAIKDIIVPSGFNRQVSSGGSSPRVWKLLLHPVEESSELQGWFKHLMTAASTTSRPKQQLSGKLHPDARYKPSLCPESSTRKSIQDEASLPRDSSISEWFR